jgi:hypothetical protein
VLHSGTATAESAELNTALFVSVCPIDPITRTYVRAVGGSLAADVYIYTCVLPSFESICCVLMLAEARQRRPCLDPKYFPKFYYKKEDSPSHQNAGTCMEY